MAGDRELPNLSAPPRERADAARNRRKILDAAARLFAEHGVGNVSMDAVAEAAGVGKGTIFRRFTDKSGLAAALLDEREREIQQSILSGPPPLGPGASAADRVLAFTDAYLDFLKSHLDLVRMSETASPGARYRIGAYRFWHRHLTILLSGIPAPLPSRPTAPTAPQVDFLAHALLGALDADLVHTLRERGDSWDMIRYGVRDLAGRLTWCGGH